MKLLLTIATILISNLVAFNSTSNTPNRLQSDFIPKPNDSDTPSVENFGLWNSTYGEHGTKNNLLESKYKLSIDDEDGYLKVSIPDDINAPESATLAVKTNNTQFTDGDAAPFYFYKNDTYNNCFYGKESNGWFYIQGNFKGYDIYIGLSTNSFNYEDERFYAMLYADEDLPEDSFFTIDTIAPIIYKKDPKFNNEVTCSYANKISQEDILDNYEFIDNFHFKLTKVILGYESYLSSMLIQDFKLTIMCSDGLGQNTLQSFTIHQIDDVTPKIIGPDIVYKSSLKIFTFDDLLSLYYVSDLSDYELTYFDGDSDGKYLYEGNSSKKGNYVVRLQARDAYNNIGVKKVDVAVYDNLAPVVMYENNVLVDSTVILELDDFVQMLKVQKIIDEKYTNEFTVTEDNYSNNATKAGTYTYKLKVRSSSGSQIEHEFKIKVNALTPNKVEKRKNWFEKIGSFFKSIGDWFWNNCFRHIANLFK